MPRPERVVIYGLHSPILMLGGLALVLVHPLKADVLYGTRPQQRRTPLAETSGDGLQIAKENPGFVGVRVVHTYMVPAFGWGRYRVNTRNSPSCPCSADAIARDHNYPATLTLGVFP